MGRFLTLVLLLILAGCSEKISEEDLYYLNGYWEIDKVILPDGGTKEYHVNTTIDFIKLDGKQGFRKKVQPKFDGTYEVSDDAESFSIIEKEGVYLMFYQNNLNEREEQIAEISDLGFAVVNSENIVYYYKRFSPINIQD